MTTIYTFDGDKIYAGAVEVDPMGPVPPGTLDAPPETTGDEVAQWTGAAWVVLPQRPIDQPVIVKPSQVYIPKTLTSRQAKLVLHADGLLTAVDAAVAQADRAVQIEWEYATEIKRDWPTLIEMASLLGLTDEQLDDLFVRGATL